MKEKILKELKPFRVPLIILGIFLVLWILLGVIVPAINESIAKTTPIVSISATNNHKYNRGDAVPSSDFSVVATHENGKTSKLDPTEYEVSNITISPIGATTTATIYLAEDRNIKCDVAVSIAREKIVGFQCGYPDVTNVTAVLYSNGELCFEGSGDVLVCDEGDYPWFDYEGKGEYPITAVSFEEGVTPTDMNFWFKDLDTLTYVAPIPASVKTMMRTFADCDNLTVAADWSRCEYLLNINEVYLSCDSLVETCPIQPSTRTAYRAYADCSNLLACADSTNAVSLTNASEMYESCQNLVSAEVGPGVKNMSSMFANCINLKDMPTIPVTVQDMSNAFANDVSLLNLSAIPSGVTNISGTFRNCQLIHGEVEINCNVKEFGGVFADACIATKLNLVGSSSLLDAYANTNTYSNVYVNGVMPNQGILSYNDVFGN